MVLKEHATVERLSIGPLVHQIWPLVLTRNEIVYLLKPLLIATLAALAYVPLHQIVGRIKTFLINLLQ